MLAYPIILNRYKLPSHIKKHIDFVTPGIHLSSTPTRLRYPSEVPTKAIEKRALPTGTISPEQVKAFNLSTCDRAITPQCVQALYQFPDQECAIEGNDMGIFEQNSTDIQRDLDVFFETAVPKILAGTQPRNVLLNGAKVVSQFTKTTVTGVGESNLDFQLVFPIIHPQNITLLDSRPSLAGLASLASIGNDSNATSAITLSGALLGSLLDLALDAIDGSYCAFFGSQL